LPLGSAPGSLLRSRRQWTPQRHGTWETFSPAIAAPSQARAPGPCILQGLPPWARRRWPPGVLRDGARHRLCGRRRWSSTAPLLASRALRPPAIDAGGMCISSLPPVSQCV
jgi:hypothetical protein